MTTCDHCEQVLSEIRDGGCCCCGGERRHEGFCPKRLEAQTNRKWDGDE